MIKDKRGMDTMAFILVALILAAIVLIALSGGLQIVIGKLKSALGGPSNVDLIKGFCQLSCNLGFTNDYCYKPRTLTDNLGNKLNDVTCYFLSRYKPSYEIDSCPKITCSVEFNNNINSKEQFNQLQCTKNKLYLQSFIQNSEKEYTLLSKECKTESSSAESQKNQGLSNDPLIRCSFLAQRANDINAPISTDELTSDEALFNFCILPINVDYKNVQYKDTTCYALSMKYPEDFQSSPQKVFQGNQIGVPPVILDSCQDRYNIFFDSNSKDEETLQNAYSDYLNCKKSNTNNEEYCNLSSISKTYSVCTNFKSKYLQFFYNNEDDSKTLITLPFECGSYKNVYDSCYQLYESLLKSGYLTDGFCDKQMDILDTRGNDPLLYKDSTCFSVLYPSISNIYQNSVMEKCYQYQYLIPKDGFDYKQIYNKIVNSYKSNDISQLNGENNFISTLEESIKCNDLFNNGKGNTESAKKYLETLRESGKIQFLVQDKDKPFLYSLVKFPFTCS